MANQKISARTALTGTGRISRAAVRAGSTTDYRTVDNFTATADPAVTDDVTDGYHAGSVWFNTTANKLFVCQDPTDGAAVWRQVMDASKNLSDLADAATARNNLGVVPFMDPDFTDTAIYLTTPHINAAAGVLAANRLYMLPVWVPRTRAYSTYGIVLTTLAGTSGIRMGLYNATGLQPTTKIDEGATQVDSSTGTGALGLKTVAFNVNQSLKPGMYYVAVLTDGTPSVMRLASGTSSVFGARLLTGQVIPSGGRYRDSVTYTTLPSDESAQTYLSQASAGAGFPLAGIR